MITFTYRGHTLEVIVLADDRLLLGHAAIIEDWETLYAICPPEHALTRPPAEELIPFEAATGKEGASC